MLGHLAMPSADLDPARILASRARPANRMTRHANGARNLLAAFEVRKEMLAKPLASHAIV
jgi:hypothetical protein